MAVAGNKNDMYEYEEVPESEAKSFAKEIGAIFQTTSAKVASGVDELFKMIGEQFLHPKNTGSSSQGEEEAKEKQRQDKVKLDNKKSGDGDEKKKKGCC